MSLIEYKWLIAALIAIITLVAGFASLHFIRRYQRFLQIGDSFADGIFLGAAAFHLFPNAIHGLDQRFNLLSAFGLALFFTACGFFLLFFLERLVIHREAEPRVAYTASAWMLTGILSVHAFITGVALGISHAITSVSVIFFAILAHKGFESFALIIGLHRGWQKKYKVKTVLFFFALVTPLGIAVASTIETYFQVQTSDFITALFSSFAAGTFLYIGTLHATHNHFHPTMDTINRYYKYCATIIGIVLMGIIGIWV